jgi:hypothetical protein
MFILLLFVSAVFIDGNEAGFRVSKKLFFKVFLKLFSDFFFAAKDRERQSAPPEEVNLQRHKKNYLLSILVTGFADKNTNTFYDHNSNHNRRIFFTEF